MEIVDIKKEKEYLIQDIKDMKAGSTNQMYLVSIYALSSYFKSLLTFGRNSMATKDCLNVIKEMAKILMTERTLLNYILKNVNSFDVTSCVEVVGLLDELNDDAVEYYYSVIGGIEDACELEDEHRALRPKLNRPTLIQDATYAGEVISLGEDFDSLKSFLGYEEEFWELIEKKTDWVDSSPEIERKMSRINPVLDDDLTIVDIKVLLPKIYDLTTALTAIEVLNKAHIVYEHIGLKIDDLSYDNAEDLKNKYKEEYLPDKAKKCLKLKM